jgi:hypothetical protein
VSDVGGAEEHPARMHSAVSMRVRMSPSSVSHWMRNQQIAGCAHA